MSLISAQGIVTAFWAAEGAARDAVLPGLVAPDLHFEIVFHLGAPWRMRRLGCGGWTTQPAAFLYGQRTGCLQFEGSADVALVACRITPVVAASLFGRPPVDLWDRPVALEDLVGYEARELLDRLRVTAGADRFAVLQSWIDACLARSQWSTDQRRAQRLFDEILWRRRCGSTAEIARDLGLSSRSLRRVLANLAGLSPKDVQLGGRLLAACALLRGERDLSITEVATRTGFFDHAAFTHAFTSRAGLSTSSFREQPTVFYEQGGRELQAVGPRAG
jgi:AraC-like DNA-binding protein